MPSFNKYGGFALLLVVANLLQPSIAAQAIEHTWSDASKQAMGTAYGRNSSKIWFTIGHGIVNEVYYPRIDRAQVGDSQLLFTLNGRLLEEKRDFTHAIQHPPGIPRTLIKSSSADGQIRFEKEVLTDPNRPTLRVRYRFAALPENTKIYLLHKPTADNDGAFDRGRTFTKSEGATAFFVRDEQSPNKAYQTVITNVPVLHASVGIVGETDGWQDLTRNGRMTHELTSNGPGNLAYTAELKAAGEIEVLIAFGDSADNALSTATTTLKMNFEEMRTQYDEGWQGYTAHLNAAAWLDSLPGGVREQLIWDATVIKAHEDKLNPGAIVASLSIPNLPDGRGTGDGKNTGGYHLVWPRDLFKSGLALLRLSDTGTALNVLRFMSRMEHDGRMSQNAWVDGRPFWTGEQMDEEAYPILLAYELSNAGVELDGGLRAFIDRRIARVKVSSGYTGQERWEEVGGFSPNTLGVMAAALSRAGDERGAKRLLNTLLTKTVSHHGPLSGQPYFIRISTTGNPDDGHYLQIANGGPSLPEYRILDGGFLEWVRWFPTPDKYFGAEGSELARTIANTLPLYDDASNGVALYAGGVPFYRRYNSDAYGLNHVGGPWPILTLERALPKLVANPGAAFKAIQDVRGMFGAGDLCPEQLDTQLQPMPHAASPLVWCHAELIELAHKAATRPLKSD